MRHIWCGNGGSLYWFHLPHAWTTKGTCTMVVQVVLCFMLMFSSLLHILCGPPLICHVDML